MKYAAIVAAAGIGSRLSQSSNGKAKQFIILANLPLYIWSVTRLGFNPQIEKIALVISSNSRELVESDLKSESLKPILHKLIVIDGGATRQDSVRHGLEAMKEEHPEFVLVHDAARPFITDEMIDSSLAGVTKYGACTLAIPIADTVKRAKNQVVVETIEREDLFLIQTPQAARFDWLLDAHRQAARDGLSTTDDAAILEAAGHKIYLIAGSTHNLKLTKLDDLALCQTLANIYPPALNTL